MNKMQNQLIQEQDQHLDEIIVVAQRLNKQGRAMSNVIEAQANHIQVLNTEIDNTTQKLNFVQAKLGKLLKTNGTVFHNLDMGQICTIFILFVMLIVMIFLVIYT